MVNHPLEKVKGIDREVPQIRVSSEIALLGIEIPPKLACGPNICIKYGGMFKDPKPSF